MTSRTRAGIKEMLLEMNLKEMVDKKEELGEEDFEGSVQDG